MKATPEQRVAGRMRALLVQGYSTDDARRLAHEIEDVPMPVETEVVDVGADPNDLEDLHWKHSCEMRRADAATRRAALAQREINLLRGVIATLDAEAERLAEQANEPRTFRADFLIALSLIHI